MGWSRISSSVALVSSRTSCLFISGLSALAACAQKQVDVDVHSVSPTCGNSRSETGEVCDGTDLGSQSCLTQGFGIGTLACNSSCDGFVTTGCAPLSICGNHVAEGSEVCDDHDLRLQTCHGLGLGDGTLACDATCTAFVTSGCGVGPGCGNDTADEGEVCDGVDLRLETCFGLGFVRGDLACSAGCQAYDTSACICDQDAQCAAIGVCNSDTSHCTSDQEICDDTFDNDGDTLVDCDDLDCVHAPACLPACPTQDLGSDTGDGLISADTGSGGNRFSTDCDATSDAPDLQYAWTPPSDNRYSFRIFSQFDAVLSLHDGSCSGAELDCVDRASSWDTEELLRDLTTGDSLVMVVDGYSTGQGPFTLDINPTEKGLCDDALDNDNDALFDCDDFDCDREPGCTTCPDLDLRSDLGTPLLSASTAGGHDHYGPSCNGNNRSPDLQLQWTAPAAGSFVISLTPSDWDAVLTVWDASCDGTELACIDTGGNGDLEQATLALAVDQVIVLSIDGYAVSNAGDFTLDIVQE